MKLARITVLMMAICAVGAGGAEAQIKVVGPKPENSVNSSDCPAKDGHNNLKPVPVKHLDPPDADNPIYGELKNGDTKFPGWTFNKGKPLSGTLTIDVYKSRFRSAHHSGAEIEGRYEKGKGDPDTLRWIQLINTDRPAKGATSPYIDPYPSDDPKDKDLPFYHTEAETPTYSKGKNDFGAFDLRFYDFSSRKHPPDSSVEWSGELYLASWDGKTPGVVTIHDGIGWGFTAGCKAAAKPPGAPMTPADSRVVLTGTVTAGDQATLSVVDAQGNTLKGVVVDIGGERKVTGDDGRVSFSVPRTISTLVTRIPDLLNFTPVQTPVLPSPTGFDPTKPPNITTVTRFPAPGSQIPVRGGPFDGNAAGNFARVGGRDLPVLASSPTELVVGLPADIPVGQAGPFTVTTSYGASEPVTMTFIRIRLEASSTKLVRGQKAEGRIYVEGTREKLTLRVTNLTPSVIRLKGGDVLTVRTSGGPENSAKIGFTGVSPGGFLINATVIEGR